MLAVIETHPVQYHAPVYRAVQERFGVPVTAIYGSDFSLAGCVDPEFGSAVAWDVDLLGGYSHRFLGTVREGGATSSGEASTRGLHAVLAELRPKAILLLGYSPRFHQAAFIQSRRMGCPMLFRGETTDHANPRQGIARWIKDAALRRYYRSFSRVLYIGSRSRAHLERLGCAPERMVFSPYCVDDRPFDASERNRAKLRDGLRGEVGIPPDHIVLLFSGKLSRRKGVDVLLEAVRRMPASLRERMALVFLGSGELAPTLAGISETEPRVRVHFAGFKNQTQLSPYYHAADLLVLPSIRSETWGLVVNDALHHGLPCVVSEGVGCAPDLVQPGSTGEVCKPGSADDLGAALERALLLTGRPEIRAACRARVGEFSVERAAQGVAEAYLEATTA